MSAARAEATRPRIITDPDMIRRGAIMHGSPSRSTNEKHALVKVCCRVACNGVNDCLPHAAFNLLAILALSLLGSTRIFGGLGALCSLRRGHLRLTLRPPPPACTCAKRR